MEHIDWIGLAGLVVALIALGVAVYGVLDVRKQVRFLVTLERNNVYAKALHTRVWRLVESVGDAEPLQASGDMHAFTMLARALDPKQTLETAQEYANKETMVLARQMVSRGLAKWRAEIDANKVNEVLKALQNDKNAAALRKILGASRLAEPTKDLLS